MEPPWKCEGPPCSHVLRWWITMAVITQLSLSRWPIHTSARYLHIKKQLASYKNTQTHTQRNTGAEYQQRWLCLTLWQRWWLLFLVFLLAFISFCDELYKAPLYNKPNQRTCKQTQPAPNSVFEEDKSLFISSEAVGKKGVGKNLILFWR